MSNTDSFPDLPGFDRSLLPDALLEFVVIGDTHYILDPEPYAVEFGSVREWPERAQWALGLAASLGADFAVHLGDLAEENPSKPGHREARRQALLQIERVGLAPHHVAGNMDIGDKPDATMWSAWVTPETLAIFHEQFGRSWYSFDHGDLHFVVINSQILNSELPEAAEQHAWLETDLAASDGQRIFLFMHMPPFFVDEDEPDTGFYNSINEPARSWIAGLARQHRIELLFAGHTHFRAFNRIGPTRLYVAPSTTTSRAGFYEAFAVGPAPEQGRNDRPKFGFYLVRVGAQDSRVHLIRTGGERGPAVGDKGWQRLLTRTSHDLANSPVGVLLRLPLAHQSAGALAWPSALRQRVRDDHPFLSCLELGVRHVRVPRSDLDDPLQNQRLQLLREEGVAVTGCWLWSNRLQLAADVARCAEQVDFVELQVPGELYPDGDVLHALSQCREHRPVSLTPVLAHEPATGKYHPRTRFGYRADELHRLDEHLSSAGIQLDRVLCHVDADASPWEAIQALCAALPLSHITSLDIVVSLPGVDEALQTERATEAVFAAALAPDIRLFLDPLVDLDRTNDVNFGLLDRLSNPRSAFHAVRCLNSILFGTREDFTPIQDAPGALGIESKRGRHWLVLKPDQAIDPSAFESDQVSVYDLVRSMSRKVDKAELGAILTGLEQPCLIRDFSR